MGWEVNVDSVYFQHLNWSFYFFPFEKHYHVTDLLPGKVLFSKGFLKHFITDYCNKNSMVSNVVRSSMCTVSWLGNNIRDVCFKNDIDLYS